MSDSKRWSTRKTDPPKRGATPLVKAKKRQWTWPQLPAVTLPWKALSMLVMLAVVVVFAHLSYRYWPITEVIVEGRMAIHSAQDIATQLLWLKQESFFTADLAQVRTELLQLPLVAAVSVHKKWPSSVIVRVQEALPVARWNDDSLLDSNGRISMKPENYNSTRLPKISAHQRYADRAARSYRLVQQVLQGRKIKIEHLSVSSSGSIAAHLSNGWNVALGQDYLEQRLQRMVRLLDNLPEQQVARLDLRYGKGAAIGWRQQENGS